MKLVSYLDFTSKVSCLGGLAQNPQRKLAAGEPDTTATICRSIVHDLIDRAADGHSVSRGQKRALSQDHPGPAKTLRMMPCKKAGDIPIHAASSNEICDRVHSRAAEDSVEKEKIDVIPEIFGSNSDVVEVEKEKFDQTAIFARSAQILADLQKQQQPDGKPQLAAGSSNSLFSCLVCNIGCSSEETLRCHLAGAKHLKQLKRLPPADRASALAALRSSASTTIGSAEASMKLSPGGGGKFVCDICGTVAWCEANFRSHLEGKRHLKTVQAVASAHKSFIHSQPMPGGDRDDDMEAALKTSQDKECTAASVRSSSLDLFSVGKHKPKVDFVPCATAAVKTAVFPSRAQILRSIPNAFARGDSLVMEVKPAELLPEMSRPRHGQYHLTLPVPATGKKKVFSFCRWLNSFRFTHCSQ